MVGRGVSVSVAEIDRVAEMTSVGVDVVGLLGVLVSSTTVVGEGVKFAPSEGVGDPPDSFCGVSEA